MKICSGVTDTMFVWIYCAKFSHGEMTKKCSPDKNCIIEFAGTTKYKDRDGKFKQAPLKLICRQ